MAKRYGTLADDTAQRHGDVVCADASVLAGRGRKYVLARSVYFSVDGRRGRFAPTRRKRCAVTRPKRCAVTRRKRCAVTRRKRFAVTRRKRCAVTRRKRL